MTLWAVGFCLAGSGVALAPERRARASRTIASTISCRRSARARTTRRAAPARGGVAGARPPRSPARRLAKRIEALASDRFQRQREVQAMFQASTAPRPAARRRIAGERAGALEAGARTCRGGGGGGMKPNWIAIGCFSAALAVMLGAYGAHGLQGRSPRATTRLRRRGPHQSIHAIALVLFGLYRDRGAGARARMAFLLGTVLLRPALRASVRGPELDAPRGARRRDSRWMVG